LTLKVIMKMIRLHDGQIAVSQEACSGGDDASTVRALDG
jgi:hypothetical protein